ncbi:MAG: arginine repressor [Clostridia bacterium]|nr:arginine repressor [Clostridia bacterium]
MKNSRQEKILQLIAKYNIDKQEDLQEKLKECGFEVTQATVSRDIRELGIIKSQGDDGVYKYRIARSQTQIEINGKFAVILNQAVSKVSCANNLIVVKTYTGMGSAVGAAFDALELDGVIGTLAGDDTLLIIASDNESAQLVTRKLNDLIG